MLLVQVERSSRQITRVAVEQEDVDIGRRRFVRGMTWGVAELRSKRDSDYPDGNVYKHDDVVVVVIVVGIVGSVVGDG